MSTTVMRLPLQRPFDGERFSKRIRGHLILIFSSPGGRLDDLIVRRNSGVDTALFCKTLVHLLEPSSLG